MSFTKFVGTFLQATFFGGTYEDVAFEVRVLKGEVARLHERLDKELARINERLDGFDGGKSGPKGKKRLRIMSAAEAADVAVDTKVEAAPADAEEAPPQVSSASNGGLQSVSRDEPTGFVPGMTIADAWRRHPEAPEVFAKHHLPGCIDCPVSEGESVEEGARLHSIDPEALLADLRTLTEA